MRCRRRTAAWVVLLLLFGASRLEAQPILSMTMTDAPDPVLAGSNITYTFTLTNSGTALTGGIFTTLVPPNTTFVSFTSPGYLVLNPPPPGSTGELITATQGTIPAGGSTVFTLVVTVIAATAPGTVINITALHSGPLAAAEASTLVAGAVPALQTWVLMGLAGLLLLMGMHALRRRGAHGGG